MNKVKYIQPIESKSAQGLVAEVSAQIRETKNNNSLGKPYLIHSPLPKVLAGFWPWLTFHLRMINLWESQPGLVLLLRGELLLGFMCLDNIILISISSKMLKNSQ